MQIKNIIPEDTYNLRHKILRPNQNLSDCQYPDDHETSSFHLGAFVEKKLISVASFYPEIHSELPGTKQYRLRGMVTDTEYRNLGAGSSLMKTAIQLLRTKKVEVLWCNARTTVSAFYGKLGMRAHGQIFDIHHIGPHELMFLELLH